MKKSSIFTVALIICLILLGTVAFTVFGVSVGGYANAEKYQAGDTEISAAVENLEINWTEGTVNIVFHEGSGVSVSETAKKPLSDDLRLRWWLDGTTLRIQYAKSGLRISADSLEKALTVSLPEGLVLGTAAIHGTSADFNIAALAAEDMILETTSGNITALVAAKKLKAGSTSGDMDIRQRGGSDSVTFDSTSGSILASVEDARVISASSTSGSVTLTQLGGADSVKLHSTSGSIKAEALSAEKVTIDSTSGSAAVQLHTVRELKIDSTSGSVTVTLPTAPGFTCKVSTASGSFNSDIALSKSGDTYACGDGSGSIDIHTTSGNIRLLEEK